MNVNVLRSEGFGRVLSDDRKLLSVCRSNVAVYADESRRHLTRTASRFPLKAPREMRCLSWLKCLWIEAGIEANFCRVFMSLNFDIATSRRRNGWCEFSALSFNQRLLSWAAAFPMIFITVRRIISGDELKLDFWFVLSLATGTA